MNNRNGNKLKMYKAVESLCTANATAWNGVPAFAAAFGNFTAKVAVLDQLVLNQDVSIVGVKDVKDQERGETADLAHKVASALRVLGKNTANKSLLALLHFPDSDLHYRGSATTLKLMSRVKDAAVQHAAVLVDYGIAQWHIDDLVQRVDHLSLTFGTTRNAIVDRGKTTELITETIRDIDGLLKRELDLLVEVLKTDYHEFALSYQKAREIVDLHGKKHKPGDAPAA
ncbi:MAG: hypothetical protein V4604_08110 [Bacteroidota bacterium]